MSNSLTRHAGLTVGPLVLETLVKHYFDQFSKGKNKDNNRPTGNLRQDDLLYDEAFTIVKTFMEQSTHHTVEELQRFSNARTPTPPWIRAVRLVVPMSSCDQAAVHLITALGGEEVAKRIVGGTKWWQVRGVRGVAAEWIAVKKDYRQAKKRHKKWQTQEENRVYPQNRTESDDVETDQTTPEPVYRAEMDEMRCILYCHGGGYYFGSVDQERYCIQRYARKINGRVLAVNYRLAPQYPFPCAIQDVLAAYLYLIRPPPGASHRPVNPAYIVVGGDSAGAGLTLALLQVIRDSGLPMPAGGMLVSPWCDLTHCFPSIHENTKTDITPPYGLSLHRPSVLWPPPPEEVTHRVQSRIRARIGKIARLHNGDSVKGHDSESEDENCEGVAKSKFLSFRSPNNGSGSKESKSNGHTAAQSHDPVSKELSVDHNLGTTAPLPPADAKKSQTASLLTSSGEALVITQQVQLYAPNNLLAHPLVSPALGYMGGLPPLLVIAGDKEVLRDEAIYLAHKAAHPDRYPLKDEVKQMYPALQNIHGRYGPTKVHLQVYDDAPHVLPVLFSFTTPAKFCFRAIATFCKYVTGIIPASEPQLPSSSVQSPLGGQDQTENIADQVKLNATTDASHHADMKDQRRPRAGGVNRTLSQSSIRSLFARRRSSKIVIPAAAGFRNPLKPDGTDMSETDRITDATTLSRPDDSSSSLELQGSSATTRLAGDPAVYLNASRTSPFTDYMIRERVSISGMLRNLEPEDDLSACQTPADLIGILSELAARRYLSGRGIWDKRFERSTKSIAKNRARNLKLAKKDTVRNIAQLQMHFFQNASGEERRGGPSRSSKKGIKEGLQTSAASWSWAWAFDADERPPPSSIVARRDTEEARRLSRIADLPTTAGDDQISGNSLWALLVNTMTPERAGDGQDEVKPGAKRAHLSRKLSRLMTITHVRRSTSPMSDDVDGIRDQGTQMR